MEERSAKRLSSYQSCDQAVLQWCGELNSAWYSVKGNLKDLNWKVRNDLQQATLCASLATDQVATGLSDSECLACSHSCVSVETQYMLVMKMVYRLIGVDSVRVLLRLYVDSNFPDWSSTNLIRWIRLAFPYHSSFMPCPNTRTFKSKHKLNWTV